MLDDPFLWFWLAIFGLGLLGLVWKGWQWRAIHAGRRLPGQHEVAWRNLICSTLTAGAMGLVWQGLDYIRNNTSTGFILGFSIIVIGVLLLIGVVVDRRTLNRTQREL